MPTVAYVYCWIAAIAAGLIILVRILTAFKWSRGALLRFFALAPGGQIGVLAIGRWGLLAISLASVVSGAYLYNSLVDLHYVGLVRAYCQTDVIDDLFRGDPSRTQITNDDRHRPKFCEDVSGASKKPTVDDLFALLVRLGLAGPVDPDSEQSADKIVAPTDKEPGSKNGMVWKQLSKSSYRLGMPTLDLIMDLAKLKSNECTTCPKQCRPLQRLKLAAALAQLPENTAAGVQAYGRSLLESSGTPCSPDEGVCEKQCQAALTTASQEIGDGFTTGPIPLLYRSNNPLTPEEIADLAAWFYGGTRTYTNVTSDGDRKELVQQRSVLRFIASLVSEMHDVDDVRAERIWINGIIGPERLAILVLAMLFVISLFVRAIKRIPHDAHRLEIVKQLYEARQRWLQNFQRPNAQERMKKAEDIENLLRSGFTRESAKDASHSKERAALQNADQKVCDGLITKKRLARVRPDGQIVTVPLRIFRAAIEEMRFTGVPNVGAEPRRDAVGGESALSDQRFVETIAEGERRDLERSRLLYDILLPTFPAIGFVGTVSSLLVAMSRANEIVKTDDPLLKGLATSNVTDILSLCFSTTLLALLCILILSPLALLQQSREGRLVDDVENAIQRVLRPGAP